MIVRRVFGVLAGAAILMGAGLPASAAPTAAPTAEATAGLAGHLTTAAGEPAVGIEVDIYQVDPDFGDLLTARTTTDGGGAWSAPGLDGGFNYKVAFLVSGSAEPAQWAYGRYAEWEAETFLLEDGATVTVDDSLAALGSLHVTATDAVTGTAVTGFCVSAANDSAGTYDKCTDTGEVTFAAVVPGDYRVETPGDDHYAPVHTQVTVPADTAVDLPLVFQPSTAITTTITDAATHAPLPDGCLYPVKAGDTTAFADLRPTCVAGESGRVTISGLTPGTYRLYAEATGYGAQWAGRRGGTGDEFGAATVKVTAGHTATAPTVRMDRPGSITGVVTDKATGQPVDGVCAFPHADRIATEGSNCTGSDGHYTIGGLGPYAWPVLYASWNNAHPWQWSGGKGTQQSAVPVAVHAGQTTTADAHLGQGVAFTGSIRGPEGYHGALTFYDPATGHEVAAPAFVDSANPFTVPLGGAQNVKILVNGNTDTGRWYFWYCDADSFATATKVAVPRKPLTITLPPPS